MIDIYFETKYGQLYESIEGGVCRVFKYKSEYGQIRHMFIKRDTGNKIEGETWYDLITPYGYGGPLIEEYDEEYKAELLKGFEKDFREYCYDNRIVSEFIRFHPLAGNAEDFTGVYDISYIRNTLGTNLRDFHDPFREEFSKSCRKNIRRALNAGVSYETVMSPSKHDVGDFKNIYYETMKRNQASEYYYFKDEYFDKCLAYFKDNLLLVKAIHEGKTIAAGFYFVYNNIIHIHLSGTIDEYMHLSPAYILRYAIMLWGKDKGYKLIHHGGGLTNSSDDSLYLFKKKFATNTEFKFYTGKRIWNEEIYKRMCMSKGINMDIDYFPAYRKR